MRVTAPRVLGTVLLLLAPALPPSLAAVLPEPVPECSNMSDDDHQEGPDRADPDCTGPMDDDEEPDPRECEAHGNGRGKEKLHKDDGSGPHVAAGDPLDGLALRPLPALSTGHCDDGLAPTRPGALSHCLHTSAHSHTYGTGGSVGAISDTVTGGDRVGVGVVTVEDDTLVDCDGDGIPGDFDGDYNTGFGGGFFGFGPWMNEPICNYGLAQHGASVGVNDVVWGNQIAFVIGADDTSGPVVTVDPVDGSTSCSTDGAITPCDPNAPSDPTCDPDDCLTDVFIGSGTTCGAGGDGGYWVFLSGVLVTEGVDGVGANNVPASGTITA